MCKKKGVNGICEEKQCNNPIVLKQVALLLVLFI